MIPMLAELAKERKAQGVILADLAERAGYERSSIVKWLSGRNCPLLSSFINLANALGYDVVLVKRNSKAA